MPSSSQAARPSASRRALKAGIDPGARHHLGAERRRARIQHLDLAADLVGADQAACSISSSRTAVSMMS